MKVWIYHSYNNFISYMWETLINVIFLIQFCDVIVLIIKLIVKVMLLERNFVSLKQVFHYKLWYKMNHVAMMGDICAFISGNSVLIFLWQLILRRRASHYMTCWNGWPSINHSRTHIPKQKLSTKISLRHNWKLVQHYEKCFYIFDFP